MSVTLIKMDIRYEQDVVATRQRARQIAELLGFDSHDQIRVATAVSEIARNAYAYASGGKAEFRWDAPSGKLIVEVSDHGPGIPDLEKVMNGAPHSHSVGAHGILAARRLLDNFAIVTAPGMGTTATLEKKLPRRQPPTTAPDISRVGAALAHRLPSDAFEEIRQQNKELVSALEALHLRDIELTELNRELSETNSGVVALYAELDEKAIALQAASETKSRFLANMSHEFRTPVASIMSLTWLLLNENDSNFTDEQRKQIDLIRQSTQSLTVLVSDLLDIAKIEAGKVDVYVSEFRLADVFGALRGMFKPLLLPSAPALIIVDGPEVELTTDEGKVAQILRNLISNAIKFTQRGEIRVTALSSNDQVTIDVTDTGIGIPDEHLELIFEEFHQVRGPLQERASGTGLGLPLSKRLAELLGGTLKVESVVGQGSTFTLTLPTVYRGAPNTKNSARVFQAERTSAND